MKSFKKINPFDLSEGATKLIGKDWALITAGTTEKNNTMTISWGGIGFLWNKPVVYTFIRPQRYTKKFIDEQEQFSLTFFDEPYRKDLTYLGRVSGKQQNKMLETNLTALFFEDIPYFHEARVVMFCRNLYKEYLKEQSFLFPETVDKNYPLRDLHMMYISEITSMWIKE